MAANPSYIWLAARARNALKRRMLVSIMSGITFVAVLIGLVLIPRQTTHAARTVTSNIDQPNDTTAAASKRVQAARKLRQTDSALAVVRRAVTTIPAPQVMDTLSPQLAAERDSLNAVLASLDSAMARAAESPLPPAFRALATSPALRNDPHVRALLDSLDQVDKLRAPFGALGAGDPIYVSLTAKLNELGRSIRDAATDKRSELRARVAPLLAPPPPPPAPVTVHADTMPLATARATAAYAYAHATHALDSVRVVNARINVASSRARDLANMGAPPIAMLASALVIALAVGFGAAFIGEVRHPRVAHLREGEAVSGARVLAVIRSSNMVERSRRQADVEAPPLIDITSESYRTLYLHLAATGASVPVVTVTGDIPAIVASIAANLAAVSAYEARSTLLVDADPASNAVASVLKIKSEPGLSGVLAGKSELPESIVSTTIGRDRPLHVLPSGKGRLASVPPEAVQRVRAALARMERRYDFLVIAAPTSYVQMVDTTIIPAPHVIVCARVGRTQLAELRSDVKKLRSAGRVVHGIVLWEEDTPRL